MSGRTVIRIVLVLVIALGAVALGVSAYNAGVTAGLAASSETPATVAPILYPYAGWGWHGGFGFFGFLGFLFFLFLFFALIRAAFWGGRGRGGWGPGGGGRYDRIREMHDELHRSGPTGTGTTGSTPTDQPRT